MTVEQLVRDRDTALLSLDKSRICVFMRTWGVPVPQDDGVFWTIVRDALIEIGAPWRTVQSAEIRRRYAGGERR